MAEGRPNSLCKAGSRDFRMTGINRRAGAVLLVGTMLGGWAAPLAAQTARPSHRRKRPHRGASSRTGSDIADDPLDRRTRQPASGAGNDPLLRQPVARPALHGRIARSGAEGPLRDPAFRRRDDHRRRHRRPGHHGRENPVINRIILEGNKRLKDDKILPEIKLARGRSSPARGPADVDRILELYRRQGASLRGSSRRSSSSTRTASMWCSKSTRATSPRSGDQHHRQQGVQGRPPAQGNVHAQAGGLLGFLKSNDTYDPDRSPPTSRSFAPSI
jgi:outer membrane protein insertion porin family